MNPNLLAPYRWAACWRYRYRSAGRRLLCLPEEPSQVARLDPSSTRALGVTARRRRAWITCGYLLDRNASKLRFFRFRLSCMSLILSPINSRAAQRRHRGKPHPQSLMEGGLPNTKSEDFMSRPPSPLTPICQWDATCESTLRTFKTGQIDSPQQKQIQMGRDSLPYIYNGIQGREEAANLISRSDWRLDTRITKSSSCILRRDSPSQYLHRVLLHAAPNVSAQLQPKVPYSVHLAKHTKLHPVA